MVLLQQITKAVAAAKGDHVSLRFMFGENDPLTGQPIFLDVPSAITNGDTRASLVLEQVVIQYFITADGTQSLCTEDVAHVCIF